MSTCLEKPEAFDESYPYDCPVCGQALKGEETDEDGVTWKGCPECGVEVSVRLDRPEWGPDAIREIDWGIECRYCGKVVPFFSDSCPEQPCAACRKVLRDLQLQKGKA